MVKLRTGEEIQGLMTAREAAKYMRVSMFTLSKMESDGGLVSYRTPGGHRRYSLRMLNRYLNDSIDRWRFRMSSESGGSNRPYDDS